MTDFRDADGYSLVGDCCNYDLCGERDFLPFKCTHCERKFCLAHIPPQTHECAAYDPAAEAEKAHGVRVLVCPVCQKGVRYESGPGMVEIAYHAHEAVCSGKPPEVQRCPAPGCKHALTTSGSVICPLCRQKVCLTHRYQDAHPCRASQLGRLDARSRGTAATRATPTAVAAAAARGARGGLLDRLEAQAAGQPTGPAKASTSAARNLGGCAEGAEQPAASGPEALPSDNDRAAVRRAVQQLCGGSPGAEQAVEVCCQTLVKVLGNVLSSPGEPKFRRLSRGNKALAAKVFAVPGAEELLVASGWRAEAGAPDASVDAALELHPETPLALLRLAADGLRGHLLTSRVPATQATSAAAAASANRAVAWPCPACTFLNLGSSKTCEMCGAARA